MEELSFSKYAQLTAPFLQAGEGQAKYARTLLLFSVEVPSDTVNPVEAASDESMKSYFTGSRSLGRFASRIGPYLNAQNLEMLIDGASFDARSGLYSALGPYMPGSSLESVSSDAANLLISILQKEAKRKRGARSPKKTEAEIANEAALIQEANGHCPICQKGMIGIEGETSSRCVITRITPPALDYKQRRALESAVGSMPDQATNEDLIALCPECSAAYLSAPNSEEFIKLLKLKQRLTSTCNALTELDALKLEKEIGKVAAALCSISNNDELVELRLDPVTVDEKIDDANGILKRIVKNDVTSYFGFIQEQFRIACESSNTSFDLIASEVKVAYQTMKKSGFTQEETIEHLASWIANKTHAQSTASCKIIVSFFIQNCEVFE